MASTCGVILVLGSNPGDRPNRAPWAPQLMPVANRPLLDHALGALGNAGVASTVVVADSETSSCVQEALADSSIAAKAVAFREAADPSFTEYAQAIVANAAALAEYYEGLLAG